MAAPGTRKRLALDSNLLIDLAAEEDYAHTFREEFQERGYSLWLPSPFWSVPTATSSTSRRTGSWSA
jgi:hypothetical protein